jgi:hypothetical protein
MDRHESFKKMDVRPKGTTIEYIKCDIRPGGMTFYKMHSSAGVMYGKAEY